MGNSWFLSRVVELAATYLVQSTLLLAPVGAFLCASSRLKNGPVPLLTERLWRFAAVLPLVTAPICLCAGWSRPILEWSLIRTRTADQTVSIRPEELDDSHPVPPQEFVASKPGQVVESTQAELPDSVVLSMENHASSNTASADSAALANQIPEAGEDLFASGEPASQILAETELDEATAASFNKQQESSA